ncbi:Peroxidase 28 [Hibiscus syriacus]|uniref:Peroxidase n=1 Tax=Hibiscus syriacus TaxID=106335 RepID=A0A6A3D2S9_HIBSY|nr:peroxidase 44-like [Hibiscus syriacus]KAE8736073.1 Peroxidase 28 [Hibiscus syriacus]
MRLKATFLLLLLILPLALANLSVSFYRRSCPKAESIVQAAVRRRLARDKSITAALLRMHFHDCFVRGCDASILIDSTRKRPSEKDAGPNLTVRGYELIDEAKKALEATCPSRVSCADIIALATRDAVFLSGGPFYGVPTGRRDGLVSSPDEVNLPGPTLSVSQAFQSFRTKNMTMDDMVTLLGAHTVGVAHCSFFLDRIIGSDPTMDRGLRNKLNAICGAANGSNPDPTAFLDQGTPLTFDNQFFKQIGLRRGVMKIDQELANDRLSRRTVSGFAANPTLFRTRFAQAMVKMGNIQVLEGRAGEIRKNCRVFNPSRRV